MSPILYTASPLQSILSRSDWYPTWASKTGSCWGGFDPLNRSNQVGQYHADHLVEKWLLFRWGKVMCAEEAASGCSPPISSLAIKLTHNGRARLVEKSLVVGPAAESALALGRHPLFPMSDAASPLQSILSRSDLCSSWQSKGDLRGGGSDLHSRFHTLPFSSDQSRRKATSVQPGHRKMVRVPEAPNCCATASKFVRMTRIGPSRSDSCSPRSSKNDVRRGVSVRAFSSNQLTRGVSARQAKGDLR